MGDGLDLVAAPVAGRLPGQFQFSARQGPTACATGRLACGEVPRLVVPFSGVTQALPLAALTTAVIVWATTFVVSADVLTTTSPATLTVLRFALAVALLVPLALRRSG